MALIFGSRYLSIGQLLTLKWVIYEYKVYLFTKSSSVASNCMFMSDKIFFGTNKTIHMRSTSTLHEYFLNGCQ